MKSSDLSVPDSYALSLLNMCKAELIYRETQTDVPHPIIDAVHTPHNIFTKGVRLLLRHKIGARTLRSHMTKFVKENFTQSQHEKYTNIYNQLIQTLRYINKKTPIVGTNIKKSVQLETNNLSYIANIDYIYSRKDGPCYGIILPDTIEEEEFNTEFASSHILTCSATMVDYIQTKDMIKYIEVIAFYDHGNDWDKFLIRISPETQEYIEFAKLSMVNILRRYHLEERVLTNWSSTCIRCAQKSGCSMFRSFRMHHRQLVQRTRQRDN